MHMQRIIISMIIGGAALLDLLLIVAAIKEILYPTPHIVLKILGFLG
jgi:hypothetical protein